ncbi:MAG: protoheme IX farnesyltransferase [Bacteroidales bacterium]|nr:protoheme IX farnesyltransferase [Bacteroidales bacterium]
MKSNQETPNKGSWSLFFYQYIKDISSLSKLIISASITFTTLTGYVISKGEIDSTLFLTLIGVFLMAAGASTINHIVERRTDALMPRTEDRPIPSGRMTVLHASIWASIFLLSGTLFLFAFTNPVCAILGLFNAIWYNLVYTSLKKISVWAVFAGTVTGIIPYFMGVLAATNQLPNAADYFIGFYMFLWQIPHFLLLVSKYGKEYEAAGLASLTKSSKTENIVLISYIWMIASCIASLYLPLFGILHHRQTGFIILAILLFVLAVIAKSLFSKNKLHDPRTPFITTNIMQAGFMLTLVFDRLIG